jgi:ribosome maturation factor RimP
VPDRDLTREIESGLADLGFELVELEKGGRASRPVLKIRIDRVAGAGEDAGISVDDCARASRSLEARLEAHDRFPTTYVLEVSSPGVERPLVRRRDFERFAGREVALQGKQPLAGRTRKLAGELLGIRGEEGAELVLLRLPGGEELEIPREEVTRANLVFRWGSEGRRT